jgi:tRNA pseudouridine38-40 synthase
MRYSICLSYDGAEFCGWQIQPSAPSVQQCLEGALSRLLNRPVSVTGAGRTDTAVNACGYIAHFDIEGELPFTQADICYKLNAILPRSVAVLQVLPVADDFHARYSAKRREYTYFIHRTKDPFVRSYSWLCGYPSLDFDAMNAACQYLLGTHDFSCFEKTGTDVKTSVCTVYEAFWKPYTPSHLMVMEEEGSMLPGACAPPHKGRGRGPLNTSSLRGTKDDKLAWRLSDEERTPEAMGGAGVERSGTESPGSILSFSADCYWYFRVSADRFLRNMVRAIVGSLIEVGRGKQPPEWIAELIASGTRGDAGESVPGHALFLSKVLY